MKPVTASPILRIRGVPAMWDGHTVTYKSSVAVDADGSPRAYGPNGQGLDYLANAGLPGNWYGIVCDHLGNPVIQGDHDPFPGMYVSQTTYGRPQYAETDPRKWVNAEIVAYVVIPAPLRQLIEPIFIGCRAVLTNPANNRQIEAVVADVGPEFGEISIAAAKALGYPCDPKTGGSNIIDGLITVLYPGTPAVVNGEKFQLQPMG